MYLQQPNSTQTSCWLPILSLLSLFLSLSAAIEKITIRWKALSTFRTTDSWGQFYEKFDKGVISVLAETNSQPVCEQFHPITIQETVF